MSVHVQRSSVIEAIYNTVLAPEGWQPTLGAIQKMFKADHVIVGVGDRPVLSGTIGVDESDLAALFNPQAAHIATAIRQHYRRGHATLRQEVFPRLRDWERSECYQLLVRPLGGYHGVLLCDEGAMEIAICRGPSGTEYDEGFRAELAALRPHFCAAREIAKRIGMADGRSSYLARMMDQAGDAIILTDEKGRVLSLNATASQISEGGNGFRIELGGAISAGTHAATQALRLAVVRAGTGAEPEGKWVALQGTDGRTSYFARVIAFTPGRYGMHENTGVCVAIFLKDAVTAPAIGPRVLFDLFGLTAREAEVVSLLLAGRTPREIGDHLLISMPTVRTHLARIFDKTDTKTQAGLVALLSRLQA